MTEFLVSRGRLACSEGSNLSFTATFSKRNPMIFIEKVGFLGFLRPKNGPMGPPRNWRAILVQKKCSSLVTPPWAISHIAANRISYNPTLNGAEKNESTAME